MTVLNFAPGGTVALHGYANFAVTTPPTTAGSAVLSLREGSQVTFAGLSATALQAAVRTF